MTAESATAVVLLKAGDPCPYCTGTLQPIKLRDCTCYTGEAPCEVCENAALACETCFFSPEMGDDPTV